MFSQDLALLAIRLIVGGVFAAHGAQKLFGWFGGYGIKGTGGFFEGVGFRPGALFAAAAGAAEFGGGLLIAAGFLGPVGATLMGAAMLVAIVAVHLKGGLFASNNGIEMPLVYALTGFALAFAGPGAFSLDNLTGLTFLDSPSYAWIGVAVAIAGGFGNLALRRPAPVIGNAQVGNQAA
jgi:putative oxidoreductase